jgi:hypothetical protein
LQLIAGSLSPIGGWGQEIYNEAAICSFTISPIMSAVKESTVIERADWAVKTPFLWTKKPVPFGPGLGSSLVVVFTYAGSGLAVSFARQMLPK